MAAPSNQQQRNVYQVGADYRRALLAREQAAVDDFTRRYLIARQQIEAELDALIRRTELAVSQGKRAVILNYGENFAADEFSGSWLYRIARLDQLEATILAEMEQLGEAGIQQVRRRVQAEIDAGTVDARSLMAFRLRDDGLVVPSQFAQLPTGALRTLTSYVSDGGPIPKAFRGMGPDLVRQMQQRLVTGLAKGENPRVIGARMKRDSADGGILDRPLYEQVRVARTEPLRAYRESARITYQANSDVVAGWEWRAFPGERTCAYCLAMDGTKHTLDEVMATHPQCRCTELPVTELSEAPPVSGAEYLYNLDADGQDAVFGSHTLGEMYRAGKVQLPDMIEQYTHPEWGRSGRAASMRSLVDRGVIKPDDIVKYRAARTARPVFAFSQPVEAIPKTITLPAKQRQPKKSKQPAAPAAPAWQPSMSKSEADAWAKGSVIPNVQKHVTAAFAERAIMQEGFDLSYKWARVWGDGVYMTDTPEVVDFYKHIKRLKDGSAEVLDLRVNVKKVLDVVPYEDKPYFAVKYVVDALPGAVRTQFGITEDIIYEEARQLGVEIRAKIMKAADEGLDPGDIMLRDYGDRWVASSDLNWYILTRKLEAAGYDAIRVFDRLDAGVSSGIGGDQLIVFNPKNVTVQKK